jgi:chromosome segregation ATPase
MKEKEEAEAQIEILNAEKIEAEAALARIGNQLSNGEDEIDVQKEKLEEIKKQIADTEKAVAEKTYLLDAMIVSGEPVEKEIQKIRDQAKDATGIFDKQPMVKIPQKTFDDMLSRYRIAGTFERLYKEFTQKLNKMQARMESLKSKNSDIEGKLEQIMSFIKERKLSEAFQEFIRPKSLRERLDGYKARVESQKQKSRDLTHDKNKGVAI